MTTVLVFDLDDTLYLERDFVESGFRAVDAWLASTLEVRGLFERAWSLFLDGVRGNSFEFALSELGVPLDPALIQAMVAVYRQHEPKIDLAPDAERLFGRLAGALPMAILTDGHEHVQRRKIAALGVERHCAQVVCTDCFGPGYCKPHTRGFETIQQGLGLPSDRFVYIADNPAKDFIAPRRLGWRTIRIERPLGVHAGIGARPGQEADLSIRTLDELDIVASGARLYGVRGSG